MRCGVWRRRHDVWARKCAELKAQIHVVRLEDNGVSQRKAAVCWIWRLFCEYVQLMEAITAISEQPMLQEML